MFGRRVFASAPLPRHMWAKMHIQNATQAQRMLPSLAPFISSLGRSTNVLDSQALTQARDGMASDPSAASLEDLSVRCFSGSLDTVSFMAFGPVKFHIIGEHTTRQISRVSRTNRSTAYLGKG
ncbi:hypothetical protein, conserved [Leishmania tarentolae]|uniref:Uncharacterized protein n=1 Tax=Leishmania tarentolae TaxID=5689 RepID=A0A640KEA3_LEITA|nr:hypothetical protein, conserved [Leishmania tarentolae]